MSDAARHFHETWLGMVQPTEGLVVSIAALLEADAFERPRTEDHHAFVELLEPTPGGDGPPRLADPRVLLEDGLGWADADLFDTREHLPDEFRLLAQARLHELWAKFYGSTTKSDLRYTPTDCFETFPFPKASPRTEIRSLEAIGRELYEARAAFMVDTDQRLTKTHNALKDPAITERSEHGPRIVHLRELHLAMDRAVLEAYAAETDDPSWIGTEIPGFTEPATAAERHRHQRFEDHVLDRLFELNALHIRR